jgi:hypothetical protein
VEDPALIPIGGGIDSSAAPPPSLARPERFICINTMLRAMARTGRAMTLECVILSADWYYAANC